MLNALVSLSSLKRVPRSVFISICSTSLGEGRYPSFWRAMYDSIRKLCWSKWGFFFFLIAHTHKNSEFYFLVLFRFIFSGWIVDHLSHLVDESEVSSSRFCTHTNFELLFWVLFKLYCMAELQIFDHPLLIKVRIIDHMLLSKVRFLGLGFVWIYIVQLNCRSSFTHCC